MFFLISLVVLLFLILVVNVVFNVISCFVVFNVIILFLKKTRGRQNTIPTRGKIYKIFGIQTKKTIAFFLLKKNEDKIS